MDTERSYTVTEMRQILKERGFPYDRSTVSRFVQSGLVKGHRVGERGNWFVPGKELQRFIKSIEDDN